MFESRNQAAGAVASTNGPGARRPGLALVVEPPSGRAVLESVRAVPPSARTLELLDGIDLESLDAHDRVSALTLWERHRSWLHARMQLALIAVGGPAPRDHDRRDDWAREDVACALRLSTTTAGSRLDVARELAGRLARTGAALALGVISYWHAKSLSDALATFDDPVAARVEGAVLDGGHPDETLANFRRRLERAVIAAAPATADEQHELAVGARRVISYPEPAGMATILATLTAAEAAASMRALTALARRRAGSGDDRPVDVLRADSFAQLFAAALADPTLPTEQRARAAVSITIDLATLAGLAQHPGHLDGYGPIPPVLARRIAAGGDWHRLVTGPVSGALLDYGRRTYRPPAELVEFIIARDRTCRFPTCNRSARLCDIDHATSWDDGGRTSAANGGALCRRNHRQKTQGNTQLHAHPDGSASWTTSTGHRYHRPAIDHCPEHTAHMNAIRDSEPDPPDPWDPDAAQEPDNDESAASNFPGSSPSDGGSAPPVCEPGPDTSSGIDPPPF